MTQEGQKRNGFTLIELLVVISVLIILVGVTLSIINPKKQRQKAEDGIRQANLEKLATAIESYSNANGLYPTAAEMADTNGDDKPDGAEMQVFISTLPNDQPTAGTTYLYSVSADQASFVAYVAKASDSSACFRYHSACSKIQERSGSDCNGDVTEYVCN